MGRALALAAEGRYGTSPNPMVGCVVVRDGEVVGEGYHRKVGGPHAEVVALESAGSAAHGATVFVTLEPCCHEGRTGPCTEALRQAGVARVVASHRDPHPAVGGQGFEVLRQAGIAVETGPGLEGAVQLNWRFLISNLLHRPAVTLKWAMSLDGRIATVSGESQWISSPEARDWGMRLREENDAILVGIGTLLGDDARLDRRLGLATGEHLRVILDRRLRFPVDAAALDRPGQILILTEGGDDSHAQALEERGAKVVRLGAVTPETVLAELHRRSVQSVMIEGGGEIHAAFVSAGLYDKVSVDCAPIMIGGREAPGPLGGLGVESLERAPRLEKIEVHRQGEDVLIEGYRRECLQELFSSVAE